MYDINHKQYILRQTSGRTLNMSYKPSAGLTLSYLSKKGVWSDTVTVTKDILPGYSVCMDNYDRIHLLCQDRQGNIKYMSHDNEKWHSKIILRSRNLTPYDKNLNMIWDDKKIYFFYTLKHSEKNILSYQIQNSMGEVSDPKVIDYVSDSPTPYIILNDPDGSIYVFYTYQDIKYSRVGYKKYIQSKRSWSDFSPITDFNGESSVLSCSCDSSGISYVCWQRQLSQNFELLLSLKHAESGKWNDSILVSSSHKPFINASLIIRDNNITIYWIEESDILYSTSNNKGHTWNSPETYAFQENEQVQCISYISNTPDKTAKQFRYTTPGTITNGYNLAFLNDSAPPEKSVENVKVHPESFQSEVLNTLKMLSSDVSEIKRFMTELDAKLVLLENSQKQFELELGRYSSKLAITDSDLLKIISTLNETKQLHEVNNQTNGKPAPLTVEAPVEVVNTQVLSSNTPIMPGAGFASITPEFLRNLQKK
ncbi:MAG: hypothetical protein N3I35_10125 [Clostridia bacterium]|nr:hypothetical protein [Clostridia bacterium]